MNCGRSSNSRPSCPADQDLAQLREQAWNQLLFEIAYQKQFDKLGLKVSPEELVDMVQGNNISPAVRQAFTNPQTGVFDKSAIISYLKGLKTCPRSNRRPGPVSRKTWRRTGSAKNTKD